MVCIAVDNLVLRNAASAMREMGRILGMSNSVTPRQFYSWRKIVHKIANPSDLAVEYDDDSDDPRLLMRGYEDFDFKLILTVGHLVRKFRNNEIAEMLFSQLVSDDEFKCFTNDNYSVEDYYEQLCKRYPKN